MPKQNPKHQKKPIKAEYVRKRKKIPFQKRQILGIIFIGVFIVSMGSIVVISYMNQNLIYVEAGDTVHVKYTLWITQSNQNWNKGELKDSSDNIDGGIFIVEMKESASETGLIKGFYEALLNQVNGSIQHQVFLEACVDNMDPQYGEIHPEAVAGDGWDDRFPSGLPFGRECKSYGNGGLIDTRLIFYIEIVNVIKP